MHQTIDFIFYLSKQVRAYFLTTWKERMRWFKMSKKREWNEPKSELRNKMKIKLSTIEVLLLDRRKKDRIMAAWLKQPKVSSHIRLDPQPTHLISHQSCVGKCAVISHTSQPAITLTNSVYVFLFFLNFFSAFSLIFRFWSDNRKKSRQMKIRHVSERTRVWWLDRRWW